MTAMKRFDALIIGTGLEGPSLAALFSEAGDRVTHKRLVISPQREPYAL